MYIIQVFDEISNDDDMNASLEWIDSHWTNCYVGDKMGINVSDDNKPFPVNMKIAKLALAYARKHYVGVSYMIVKVKNTA